MMVPVVPLVDSMNVWVLLGPVVFLAGVAGVIAARVEARTPQGAGTVRELEPVDRPAAPVRVNDRRAA